MGVDAKYALKGGIDTVDGPGEPTNKRRDWIIRFLVWGALSIIAGAIALLGGIWELTLLLGGLGVALFIAAAVAQGGRIVGVLVIAAGVAMGGLAYGLWFAMHDEGSRPGVVGVIFMILVCVAAVSTVVRGVFLIVTPLRSTDRRRDR